MSVIGTEAYSDSRGADYPVEQSFLNEIITQCRPGPGVELPTAKMFQTLVMYHESEPIKALLSEASTLMVDRGIKPGAAVSGLRTTLVHYFRSRYAENHNGEEFPDANLLNVHSWKPYFDMLIDDATAENGTMAADYLFNAGIFFLDAVTPVKERYLSVELLAHIVKDRFPNGIRVLDYGSSVMAGPLYLMHKDLFSQVGFESVTHTSADGQEEDLTSKANEIGSRTSPFKEFVCVDIFNVYYETKATKTFDYEFFEHAISGLRPSERNNPSYLEDLKKAKDIKQKDGSGHKEDSGVTFEQASFLEPSDLAGFKEKYQKPFDMIVMNYVTQELSSEEQLQLHDIMLGLLSENGIIIYNHQAHIPEGVKQPASVHELQHYGSYATKGWLSNGHVVDKLHPVNGLQEVINYYDNRCRHLRLGLGRLMVNGSLEPIVDLIRNS